MSKMLLNVQNVLNIQNVVKCPKCFVATKIIFHVMALLVVDAMSRRQDPPLVEKRRSADVEVLRLLQDGRLTPLDI
jgi:hypothetical protein